MFLLGAAFGDITGSIWEGRRIKALYQEPLLTIHNHFTDDTVMTAAINDWLKGNFRSVDDALVHYGRKYPHAGYGGSFKAWFMSENRKPYNSWGDGSAMRVSPVPYHSKSLEECQRLAKESAECTHNHPEGIKGAVCVASMIYKILKGSSKKELLEYACEFYPEIKDIDVDELIDDYGFEISCQKTVPQAIACFLVSESFEDCLRLTRCIGGDADTLCAISCSMAEAFYGIPDKLAEKALQYIPKELQEALAIDG